MEEIGPPLRFYFDTETLFSHFDGIREACETTELSPTG